MSNWIVIGSRAPIACQLSIYARNSNKMESILTPIQSPTKTIIYNSTVFILLFFLTEFGFIFWYDLYFILFFFFFELVGAFFVFCLNIANCILQNKTKQNKKRILMFPILIVFLSFPFGLLHSSYRDRTTR